VIGILVLRRRFDGGWSVRARPQRLRVIGATHELCCSRCGYGVVVKIAPVRCPMCGGAAWEFVPGRSVARS
jgi:rubrerythrin